MYPQKISIKIMFTLTYFTLIWSFQFYVLAYSKQNNWKHLDISCDGYTSLHVLRKVSNTTTVTLGNCTYTLTSPLTISAVQGIHIIGNDSVINCTGDNAGIMFEAVTELLLERITFLNCGFYPQTDKLRIASVQIKKSLHIVVRDVIIENGKGTGLCLLAVGGNVTIEDCIFRHNRYSVDQMLILNAISNDFSQRGGGMQISIGEYFKETGNYQILNCKFLFNYALSGGGMFVVIQYGVKNFTIRIKNNEFIQNSCYNGGGGIQMGYTSALESPETSKNLITLDGCLFKNNQAEYGGGLSIFSSLGTSNFTSNKILLNNCSWSKNIATRNGMAVDISIAPWETMARHGLCPKFQFTDCNFTDHSPTDPLRSLRSIFTVTRFEIFFKNQIVFERNNGTAVEAISALLSIRDFAQVYFRKNQGINGGAMMLKCLSVILVHDNATFVFQENNALKTGGAIYVDSSDRQSCFIKKQRGTMKQSTFVFSNNTASSAELGNSIFASSLLPCLKRCIKDHSCSNLSMTEALNSIGKFEFDETSKIPQLTTAPNHFSNNATSKEQDSSCDLFIKNSIIYLNPKHSFLHKDSHIIIPPKLNVIPGKKFVIPFKLVNELCEKVPFHVSVELVESTNGSMFINNSFITNNNLEVYGNPHDRGTLRFSATGVHKDIILFIQLDNCPPGYIHNTKQCVCSLSTKWHYPGIERCSTQEYKAYVRHGYWFGYVNNQTTQETLASAICPKGFCVRNATEYPLPSEATNDLSSYVCNNRIGVICGNCKENYSTYYRSAAFLCESSNLCYLGWLFYLASEILPVTVLFFIIIYFNISFTSGALNGVILFMQLIDTLKTDGENFIQFGNVVLQFARMFKIVYRVFLLKFFALEEFSFCLWKGATALDMLAFRYITIVYSLFLVIITVVILRKCTCRFGKKEKKPSSNLKHSILNGLSAFLVMSYSECTQVTLMILTRGTLTVGPMESIFTSFKYELVAFYNGNYQYMGPEHLKYALPAIAFLLTLVTLPPILLIVYPLCYKLFALLRIDESKFVKIVCKVIPLEKIKPMFDSIQGEFKDRYRFFAGLYFIYRFCTSVTFTYASAFKYYYFATNIQLTVILVIHSICWPYKKKWHNVLDALLFGNLAVINAIASINYISSNRSVIISLAGLQRGLILLPLVYLVVYTIYNIVKKIKAKKTVSSHQKNDNNLNDHDVLEMLDTRSFEDSDNYVLLNDESQNQ